MNILGICTEGPQSTGACLLVDGKLVAMAEEERFVRIKQAPGLLPSRATQYCLKTAGLKQQDMDWIELNEAFAAQALAVIRDLGLNTQVVNPMGGAIALGHPLGATGAIRAATVVHALRRNHLKYGMLTMCVGTGMGAAGIFERV